MSQLNDLLVEATHVGSWMADLETAFKPKERGTHDEIHHLGDDTGDLVTQAYRHHGAETAASVIEAYLVAFNARRRQDGIRPLTPPEAIANIAWAIRSGGITRAEQAEVRDAFMQRYGNT